MPDQQPGGGGWVGQEGRAVADGYREMADYSFNDGVSPSYERLSRGIADDPRVLELLAALPSRQWQPNLLFGAVRYLGGPIGSYPEFVGWTLDHWSEVAAVMDSHATQTNEAGRCATLLPVLAAVEGPVALFEVGASGGLCLYPDRYAYRYELGDDIRTVGCAELELACTLSGPVPVPTRLPDVVWRGGLDLNPLDLGDDATLRWLEALVWPEQTRRFEVLRGAAAIARQEPAHIVAGDLTRDLEAAVAEVPAGPTLVIQHSAVLAYVDRAGRDAFRAAIGRIAAARPTVWIANEAPGIVEEVDRRLDGPAHFVLSVDGRAVARTGPHGHSVEWTA